MPATPNSSHDQLSVAMPMADRTAAVKRLGAPVATLSRAART
ncbi:MULTISPECIES: hypothetical protein [Acidiphilium]|nr:MULTISPECIES: hypothetical protein [Acidiphilium]